MKFNRNKKRNELMNKFKVKTTMNSSYFQTCKNSLCLGKQLRLLKNCQIMVMKFLIKKRSIKKSNLVKKMIKIKYSIIMRNMIWKMILLMMEALISMKDFKTQKKWAKRESLNKKLLFNLLKLYRD